MAAQPYGSADHRMHGFCLSLINSDLMPNFLCVRLVRIEFNQHGPIVKRSAKNMVFVDYRARTTDRHVDRFPGDLPVDRAVTGADSANAVTRPANQHVMFSLRYQNG